jgi:hypothetical protein
MGNGPGSSSSTRLPATVRFVRGRDDPAAEQEQEEERGDCAASVKEAQDRTEAVMDRDSQSECGTERCEE